MKAAIGYDAVDVEDPADQAALRIDVAEFCEQLNDTARCCFAALASGCTNRETAAIAGVSVRAVETMRRRFVGFWRRYYHSP